MIALIIIGYSLYLVVSSSDKKSIFRSIYHFVLAISLLLINQGQSSYAYFLYFLSIIYVMVAALKVKKYD